MTWTFCIRNMSYKVSNSNLQYTCNSIQDSRNNNNTNYNKGLYESQFAAASSVSQVRARSIRDGTKIHARRHYMNWNWSQGAAIRQNSGRNKLSLTSKRTKSFDHKNILCQTRRTRRVLYIIHIIFVKRSQRYYVLANDMAIKVDSAAKY